MQKKSVTRYLKKFKESMVSTITKWIRQADPMDQHWYNYNNDRISLVA